MRASFNTLTSSTILTKSFNDKVALLVLDLVATFLLEEQAYEIVVLLLK
jgi:hypothetical protein